LGEFLLDGLLSGLLAGRLDDGLVILLGMTHPF